MSGRQKVVDILMKRDGVSKVEAEMMIDNAIAEIDDCFDGTSCLDPEEVIMLELGPEPDYLMDLI